ncbi:flagellar motor switch protein FliN/FliY [Allopseudospirillum japonicum]|uniref:Flagellar motor switch protein FliN n=1 Tax=Allopseudospirillum japonicum TaxID=64971 RepID=A0A1H6R3Y6_9GAMM|nr:flagellar motor switch protein FliN [Allopseudospirillum japonicum]SEI45902.1 flagellar motor switch protein FliN/FliY [Allopseudospirillum japonicum]
MSDDPNKGENAATDADDWAAALEEEDTGADDWAAAMEEQAEADAGGAEDDWAAAMQEQAEIDAGIADDPNAISEDDIQPAPLEYLEDSSPGYDPDNPNLEVIMDIPVTISMEVGSTEIAIRNLLQLNQGSVIELDRLAGEPLDVKVNGTLIAHGEVVMVNEKFGIRLTDVVSPSERIKRLR